MNRKYTAHIAIILSVITGLCFLLPKNVYATDPQKCIQNETCKIGEFLYNDDYTANSSATCTITSRDPSGTLFLDATALTEASGYYSYSATPTTLGTYPTQICCTVSSELMCIDKTFEVVEPVTSGSSLSAADVWNYGDRSLTDFGSLVENIWDYSNRSLTTFGTLVSNIWTSQDRSLTTPIIINSTTTITKKDLEEINIINKENRDFLQKLVSKPLFPNLGNTDLDTNVNTKINDTKNVLNNLFATLQNLKNKSQILSEQWSRLSPSQITTELSLLKKIVENAESDTDLINHVNWLKTSWSSEIFMDLSNNVYETSGMLTKLISDSEKYKTGLFVSYQSYLDQVNDLDTLTGNTLSTEDEYSAFGFVKKTTADIDDFNKHTKNLESLVSKTTDNEYKITLSEVDDITKEILTQNAVEDYEQILNLPTSLNPKKASEQTLLRNKIYSLLALINLNKHLLASSGNDPIRIMWLEEGSMVFRTVATNPSKSKPQTIEVKFILPTELKKEHIISYDPKLKLDYDSSENALFALATVDLAPGETTTFAVESEDLWQFNPGDIELLRKKATDLYNTLKNTSYRIESGKTKNEILASLDKILVNESQIQSPENKIKTYRDSSLELINTSEKINSLEKMVAEAHQAPKNQGLFGSPQVVGIWGVVIIGLAGFLFLSFYLKTLRTHGASGSEEESPSLGDQKVFPLHLSRHHHKESKNIRAKRIVNLIVIGLIGSGLISVIGTFTSRALQYNKTKNLTLQTVNTTAQPKQISLKISEEERVPVKSGPSISSPEVLSLKTDQNLYVYRKLNGWVKVGLTPDESETSWWVSELYIK